MTELEALESAQDEIAAAKKALSKAAKHLDTMVDINMKASHKRNANIAALYRDKFRGLRAEVGVVHAEGTEALYQFWPDWADEIVTRSGHR